MTRPTAPARAVAPALAMPAEWARHEATWLAWPHHQRDWPGKFGPIPWVYAEIVRWVARGETVRLLVNDAAQEKKARAVLRRAGVGGRAPGWASGRPAGSAA